MAHGTFQVGNLTAVIGDNQPHEQHRAGYNGIHQLIHRDEPTTLFVPAVAGLNLEHIFDGDKDLRGRDDPKIFFDITPSGGQDKGLTYLGIYELGENTRKVCIAPPGAARPKDFTSTAGSERIVVTFERVKDK
jgi:hypothetical protein